jgi:serine/threonine protein kinase/tetratricopeptide (TPR) repeat protein
MGEVYRAKDTRLGRDVAIKILPKEMSTDPARKQRFEREAKIISRLNHPNICVLHDIGHQDGIDYLVMECVEGETVAKRMKKGPLPLAQILEWAIQISEALDQAHRQGITHRDLKPGNIMLTTDSRAKVLDFGLAKQLVETEGTFAMHEETTLELATEYGSRLGTCAYMSPEQALGKQVDSRTDLFSFGTTLYEMATRKRPFEGRTSIELCDAILHREPIPPKQLYGSIPDKLQEIILKCLEKKLNLRYQSAAEIGADLRRMQRDSDSRQGYSGPRQMLPVGPRRNITKRTIGAVVTLFLVLGITLWIRHVVGTPAAAPGEIHSLAVLPLKNLSADSSQEYFADGTTLDLITTLTKIGNLSVISWTSVRGYKNTTKRLPEIAKELNADAVIDGSVQRIGDRVKITIELTRARGDRSLWAQSYDRELRDILRVQEEVAGTIAREVRVALTPQDHARLSETRSVDPEAYLLYTQGRSFMQRWTPETYRDARESFHQAIQKDPNYALAYAGLAETYLMGDNLDPKVSVPLARAAAAKALALDDTVSDAHVATAQLKCVEDWDWNGAEREFKRAIELNPGDTLAHHLYSHLLMTMGRNEESFKESELYLRLDPLSPAAYDHLGFLYLAMGQYEAAVDAYRKTQLLDPKWESSHQWLGDAYRLRGMSQQALSEYEQALVVNKTGPESVEALRRAFEKGGWKGYWGKSLEGLLEEPNREYISPYSIAVLYARLGDKQNAFRYLDKAYANHDDSLPRLKIDRDFDLLQDDPRYVALLKKMGLPLSSKTTA